MIELIATVFIVGLALYKIRAFPVPAIAILISLVSGYAAIKTGDVTIFPAGMTVSMLLLISRSYNEKLIGVLYAPRIILFILYKYTGIPLLLVAGISEFLLVLQLILFWGITNDNGGGHRSTVNRLRGIGYKLAPLWTYSKRVFAKIIIVVALTAGLSTATAAPLKLFGFVEQTESISGKSTFNPDLNGYSTEAVIGLKYPFRYFTGTIALQHYEETTNYYGTNATVNYDAVVINIRTEYKIAEF